jgi:hypothetical protein
MPHFRLPLLAPGDDARTAFEKMRAYQRSGAVAEAGGEYFLIEARFAFAAWRRNRPWDPARDGMALSRTAGRYRLHEVIPSEAAVVLDSSHEYYAGDFAQGPPACYCPQCEQPARRPGACMYCGNAQVDCAP